MKEYNANGTAVTSFEYDAYGRQIAVHPSNAGSIYTNYTPFGQLISKDDTGSDVFTYCEYNNLGLLTDKYYSKNNGDGWSVFYTYDSKKRLTQATTSDNNRLTYAYDNYDRVTRRSDIIGTEKTMNTQYTYDSYGRVATQQYPSGYTITNHYDANGYLIRVTDNRSNVVWQLESANAYGQTLVERKGANQTTYTYNTKGQLTRALTHRSQSLPTKFVDMTYRYYTDGRVGNLSSRMDAIALQADSFRYDTQDRLTRWGKPGTGSRYTLNSSTMSYDTNTGNIAIKNSKELSGDMIFQYGGGIYSGDEIPPHAPAGITGGYSRDSLAKTENITYTPFRKIKTLDWHDGANGYRYAFTYGPNEQRMKMTWNRDGTADKKYYAPDYEEEAFASGTRQIHYVYGGNGLAGIMIKQGNTYTLYHAYTDLQGSIIALTTDNEVVQRFAYDPWGMRRNPNDWAKRDGRDNAYSARYTTPRSPYLTDRGYTGHEHIYGTDLINMNGRVYDTTTSTFLSTDPYIQDPNNWLNHLPYSYCLNNPLKYVDPSGEIFWVPVIVGAIIGAYSGGVIANDGQFNPTQWDYSSGKTWGYMLGGAVVGGASGYVGGAIAGSGMPMANMVSIASSSLLNSGGTLAYTGGQTPISVSLGIASYDFTNGTLGYLGKNGNKWYENLGYGLGAVANSTDAFSLFRGGGQNIKVNSAGTTGDDWWGHSSITGEKGKSFVSVGPNPNSPVEKIDPITGNKHTISQIYKNSIKGANRNWDTYLGEKGTWSIELNNVSTKALSSYASGVTQWDLLLNSCVGHTSRALWSAGVPNIYLFHPHTLNAQLLLMQYGMYASPYLYRRP